MLKEAVVKYGCWPYHELMMIDIWHAFHKFWKQGKEIFMRHTHLCRTQYQPSQSICPEGISRSTDVQDIWERDDLRRLLGRPVTNSDPQSTSLYPFCTTIFSYIQHCAESTAVFVKQVARLRHENLERPHLKFKPAWPFFLIKLRSWSAHSTKHTWRACLPLGASDWRMGQLLHSDALSSVECEIYPWIVLLILWLQWGESAQCLVAVLIRGALIEFSSICRKHHAANGEQQAEQIAGGSSPGPMHTTNGWVGYERFFAVFDVPTTGSAFHCRRPS